MSGSVLPEVTIHVLRGKASAASRPMRGRSLLIGSGPHCDIEMRSADIAAKHALITRDEGGVSVRALDSDRPVLLNQAAIVEARLADGDTLKLGPFELSIAIQGPAAGAPAIIELGPDEEPLPVMANPAVSRQRFSGNLAVVEEAKRLDDLRRRLDARRGRLLRVRRKFLAHLRRRRDEVAERSNALERETQQLQFRRNELDAEAMRQKRLADDLATRQAELSRAQTDHERALEALQRREEQLEERIRRFEGDVEAVHLREKDLLEQQAELHRREGLACERESSLREGHAALAVAIERARQDAEAIHQRREELEGRLRAVELRETEQAELASSLERQRLEQEALDQRLSAREVEMERIHAEVVAIRRQLDADRAELLVREESLARLSDELSRRENWVRQIESQAAAGKRDIEVRWTELDAHAMTLRAQLEAERESISLKQREIEELHASATARLKELDQKKEEWFARLNEVREIARDLAERQRAVAEQVARRAPAAGGDERRDPMYRLASTDPREAETEQRGEERSLPLSLTDEEVAAAVVRAGLMEESELKWYRQSAAGRRVRLLDEILRTKALTAYQIRAAGRGDLDELHLGPAKVLDILHVGCVATTYKITMPGCEAPLAARMLKVQWSRDPARRRQHEFVLESLKEFRHPNVIATYGSIMAGERFGSLTEYVEAKSLAEIADRAVPPVVLVNVCYQAIAAVVAAERAGLVHQNIRPSRLLLTRDGTVRVLGYGEPAWLSKIHRCEKGRSLGPYAAPEIAQVNAAVDARADLYSIGQICQQLALHGTSATTLLDRQVADDFPDEFRRLVCAMLSPTPAHRPHPAEALAALDAILDASAILHWPDFVLVWGEETDVGRRIAA